MPNRSPIPGANAGERATLRAPRILVADDERDFVLTLTRLLTLAGYEVRGVFSALQVQEAIVDFGPDIVLLDIGMPGMSGYDVAHSLRKTYGSARPVLVAVTGRSGESHQRIARMAGIDHCLGKPFQPAALLELLESILTRLSAPPA